MNDSVCFTGYRPNKFPFDFSPENEIYQRLELKIYDVIEETVEKGYENFYCGMAQGFDLLSAELLILCKKVLKSDCNLISAIPYKNQTEGWGRHWQERYESILSLVDKTIILSDAYYRGCFDARNQYMVEHSKLIITYYDGKYGATKSTLEYGRKRGLEIINIADLL